MRSLLKAIYTHDACLKLFHLCTDSKLFFTERIKFYAMDFGMKILMFVFLVVNVTMLKAKPHREWRDVYNSDRFVRTVSRFFR